MKNKDWEALVSAFGSFHYRYFDLKDAFNYFDRDKIGRVIKKLSEFGWYLNDFSKEKSVDYNYCLTCVYGRRYETLDKYLVDHFKKELKNIESSLIDGYPDRKEIIQELFITHKNKLYHSSICLAITLMDGICYDNFEKKFFLNDKKHLPQIRKPLKNTKFNYADFLLTPIENKGSLNAWHGEIGSYPVRLNRNEIIHGIDIEYGNEKNSLKMISALSYLYYVMDVFKEGRRESIPFSFNWI